MRAGRRVLYVVAVSLGIASVAGSATAQDTTRGRGSLLEPYSLTRSLDDPRSDAAESLGAMNSRLELGIFDVGVKVAPRRPSLALGVLPSPTGANSPYRLLTETDLTTTDVGLDLRLRWPSSTADADSLTSGLRPYVSLGPALALPVGEEPLALSRGVTRAESARPLGLRGALGLTWQLAPDASLFGEYRLSQDHPFGRRGIDDVGTDIFYGLSVRF
jgi:hypothetical protein